MSSGVWRFEIVAWLWLTGKYYWVHTAHIRTSIHSRTVFSKATTCIHSLPIDRWQQQNCDCTRFQATEAAPPEEGLPDWRSSTWRGTAWLKELHLKRDCLTEAALPEEGLPDWSSSTWRETDYLTEGASSAPANGCSLLLSLLPQPPCSWCLVPGMFKLSCSTHFTHFLRLVSVYRLFHLYFIPKTLTTMPVFSAPFLQLISVNRPFHLYFIPKTHHDASVFSSLPAADFCQPALRPVFHSKNSPRCLCFQLPSCNWFLSNQPFSCICLD